MHAGWRVRATLGSVLAVSLLVGSFAVGWAIAFAQEAPAPPSAPEGRGPVVSKGLPKTPLPEGEVGAQVIDGSPTSTTVYPWMGALLDPLVTDPFDAQFCAGTLIAPQWVVTAGHCADGETTSSIVVAFGHTDLSTILSTDRRTISEIHIHPSFAYQGPFSDIPANDIALLKLSSPATGIPTLSYDAIGLNPTGGLHETIVGWGAVDIDFSGPSPAYLFSDTLQHGQVDVAAGATTCGSYLMSEFTGSNMLCANPTSNFTDTCPGDSGGPLLLGGPGGYRLMGITGWGYPFCSFDSGAYTKVSTFATWIDGYLGDPGAVGTFNPVAPVRILDTRPAPSNVGALLSQPVAPGQSIFPQVTGFGGVPVSGVTAVALNVTVTGPTSGGWLTLFPAGNALPTASNLNFVAGQTVPNFVTVKLGQGGKIGVNNTGLETGGGTLVDIPGGGAGTVNVIIDIVGWYTADTAGAYYHAVEPTRILDTRSPVAPSLVANPLWPQTVQPITVSGGGAPIPLNGASAVVLNVTATGAAFLFGLPPTASGWLTLFPSGLVPPTASNLNFTAGQTIANLVTVGVSSQQVKIANTYGNPEAGFVHVVVDLVGYYGPAGDASGGGGRFNAMTPKRLVDSRGVFAASTPNPSLNTAVGPQATIAPFVAGVPNSVPTGVPGTATAVVVNGTATGSTQPGWLTMFPEWGLNPPLASNLNFVAGQTVPNAAIVKVGPSSKIGIANSYLNVLAGTTHVVLDVVGWFEP